MAGMGYATTLLKIALADMNADEYELSFLAPFSQRYYRRLGYEQAISAFTYEIDSQKLRPAKVKVQRKVERTPLQIPWVRLLNIIAKRLQRKMEKSTGNNGGGIISL